MRWLLVVAAVAVGGPAQASPGDEAHDGAVFAGPTGPSTGAVIGNPAALLRFTPGFHLFVDGVATFDQVAVDRRLVAEDGTRSDGPSVRASTFGAGGSAGVIKTWPGGMIAFAFALPPPDETVAGQAALAYRTRGDRTRRIQWGAIAGGYRFTSRLSVGLAGALGDRRTYWHFDRDSVLDGGRDPVTGVAGDCGGERCGLEHPAATEQWSVEAEPDLLRLDNLILSVGALIALPGNTWLGVTYQRPWQRGNYAMAGTARVVRAPRDGGATVTGDATVIVRLPEVIRLGTRTRLPIPWEVVTELRWRVLGRTALVDIRTHGGDFTGSGIPEIELRQRGYRDAVAFEAGLEQVDAGQLARVGFRLGADTGVVPIDRLSAAGPWGAQLTAATGLQLRLASRWVVQLGYVVAWQARVTADPGAFDPIAALDCADAGHDYDLPACQQVRDGFGTSSAAGSYGRWSHVGRLGLRFEVQ